MSTEPREFWICDLKSPHGLTVLDNYPASMQEIIVVHVIEHSAYRALEQKLAVAVEALEFYANPETYIETHNDIYLKIEPKHDEELIRHYRHKTKKDWVGTVKVGGKRARKALALINADKDAK